MGQRYCSVNDGDIDEKVLLCSIQHGGEQRLNVHRCESQRDSERYSTEYPTMVTSNILERKN